MSPRSQGLAPPCKGPEPGDVRTVTTNENGFFEIRDVVAGRPYAVSIRAAGFSEWDSPAVTLEPGQSKILDVSKLQIQEVQTNVTVTPESDEQIATEQVKTEEKQRGFLVIPNFYAAYTSNPAPLTAKLKFSLAFRVARDPFTLAGSALLGGFDQAADSPKYVQGAQGYGERLGANYANAVTDVMLDGAILPTLLHQDPRYFYQGTGTTRSRTFHVLASLFVTKGGITGAYSRTTQASAAIWPPPLFRTSTILRQTAAWGWSLKVLPSTPQFMWGSACSMSSFFIRRKPERFAAG
jgi:hypothetical protein